MLDTPQRVTEWATRLNLTPELTKELISVMYSVPKSARERILNVVLTQGENTSPIKFCAESILKFAAPAFRDGERHLLPDTDSLLSLVPELASTYSHFSVHPSDAQVYESFRHLLHSLSGRRDTPENFIYDHALESHLTHEMHGILISYLATGEALPEDDLEWLGARRSELAQFATVLYERDTVDKDFCLTLLGNSGAVAGGTL